MTQFKKEVSRRFKNRFERFLFLFGVVVFAFSPYLAPADQVSSVHEYLMATVSTDNKVDYPDETIVVVVDAENKIVALKVSKNGKINTHFFAEIVSANGRYPLVTQWPLTVVSIKTSNEFNPSIGGEATLFIRASFGGNKWIKLPIEVKKDSDQKWSLFSKDDKMNTLFISFNAGMFPQEAALINVETESN